MGLKSSRRPVDHAHTPNSSATVAHLLHKCENLGLEVDLVVDMVHGSVKPLRPVQHLLRLTCAADVEEASKLAPVCGLSFTVFCFLGQNFSVLL